MDIEPRTNASLSRIRAYRQRTFASLAVRNYRLFVIGQAISLSGTWMQSVAQGLLVLQLTGSGTALGIVTALQTLPVLVFGAWGGVIADRFPKRRILYVTQVVAGLASLAMGLLVLTDLVTLPAVYALAILLGFVKVFENPTRQTFVREMVGNERLTNAVSLNSTMMNLARVIGPAIAGILVATVGLAYCFILDGLSYGVVLAMLFRMRADELRPARTVARARGQLQEGLRYAWSTPAVRTVLLMMALIGTFTYEFSVVLPLFSEFTFETGASGYAALTAAMGLGAVAGGLYSAGRRGNTPRMLVTSAALFGLSVLATALTPNLTVALIAMVVVGFFSISFTTLGNATLQLTSAPEMQGRVMALWTVSFLGTTPIGGPIMGAIGEHAGARYALAIGGIAALVAAGIGLMAARRIEAAAARQDEASLPAAHRPAD